MPAHGYIIKGLRRTVSSKFEILVFMKVFSATSTGFILGRNKSNCNLRKWIVCWWWLKVNIDQENVHKWCPTIFDPPSPPNLRFLPSNVRFFGVILDPFPFSLPPKIRYHLCTFPLCCCKFLKMISKELQLLQNALYYTYYIGHNQNIRVCSSACRKLKETPI